MIENQARCLRYRVIKFEEVLKDPFGTASQIFDHADLEPVLLEKLG